MTADLLERLDAYRHTLESAIREAEAERRHPAPVLHPTETVQILDIGSDNLAHGGTDSWFGQRWPVILAGAAAAAIIIVVLLFTRGDDAAQDLIYTDDTERQIGPAVTDPVTSTTVADPTPSTTTVRTEPAAPIKLPVPQQLEIDWSDSQSTEQDSNPFEIAARSSNALFRTQRPLGERFSAPGLSREQLMKSVDGGDTWEEILPELTEVSVVADGDLVLVTGRRGDEWALLASRDAQTWVEVDYSALPNGDPLEVVATTSRGLTWFKTGPYVSVERVFADGSDRWEERRDILAVLDGNRLIDVHDPPWELVCCHRELFETSAVVGAVQRDFDVTRESHAWTYLGGGQWSEATEIPFSFDFAQVGDTILKFDHTNRSWMDPTPGVSHWPLLASNDGINWTEIGSFPAEDVHLLRVQAGDDFWVYGPQLQRDSGLSIDIAPTNTIRASADGINWQPIDVEFAARGRIDSTFVHVDANRIELILVETSDGEGTTRTYSVGTVTTVQNGAADPSDP